VLSDTRILIGRTAEPVDRAGRPRRNHVVFLDEASEHNATVGRAHASIRFEADRRQFRLFDDGSHNGTRIVRQGETIDVTPHNPVGVALLSGDEIQFGTAAVVVTIEGGH
jgi:pSer/pThr/pTyr-binding forkhead associated (FHA) protein